MNFDLHISGEELNLRCTADTEWSICTWEHEIEDQKVRNKSTQLFLQA